MQSQQDYVNSKKVKKQSSMKTMTSDLVSFWTGEKQIPALNRFCTVKSYHYKTMSTALTVTVYILWWSSFSLEPEHKEYIGMIQKPPTLKIHIKKIHKRNAWLLIFSPGRYTNVTQNKKEVPLIVINDANHNAGKKKEYCILIQLG